MPFLALPLSGTTMHPAFTSSTDARPVPITFASKSSWDSIRATLPTAARRFAESNGFAAKPGQYLALPAEDGSLAHVLFGIEDQASEWRDLFRPGQLPGLLPAGTYSFANAPHDMRLAALAFALGSYRFNRYRKNDAPSAKLVPPADVDITEITRMADAAALARDLINTPANDMGPEELAQAAKALAEKFGAKYSAIMATTC
jgi:leucyl aminopeptidase